MNREKDEKHSVSNRDICSLEQISTPGSIQPHGFIIGLDAATFALTTKSDNIDCYFPLTRQGFVPEWLPSAVLDICRNMRDGGESDHVLRARLSDVGPVEFHIFKWENHIFCEFEPVDDGAMGEESAAISVQINMSTKAFFKAATIYDLSKTIADLVRSISGFDRIMVYRFDEEGNGEVIGESVADDWDQHFLGLRFPASDIPAQARELYKTVTDRWIPVRDYVPVPLLPSMDATGKPFDLSHSRYRSVSAVHRLYQKNIGTDGAMSISLMCDGTLWGLMIGHHRHPKKIPLHLQHRINALARLCASHIDIQMMRDAKREVENEIRVCSILGGKLANAKDIPSALIEGSPKIDSLLPGCVGAAVIWHDSAGMSRIRTCGKTPPSCDVLTLQQTIAALEPGPVFASDCLIGLLGEFQSHRDIASGVIAVFFDDENRTSLLLFRPEVERTVCWAGRPEKLADDNGNLNLPRHSFDRWTEIKHGHSQKWRPWEIDTMHAICSTVNAALSADTQVSWTGG